MPSNQNSQDRSLMKALSFDFKLARFIYSKIFGMLSPEAYFGRFSALRYSDHMEPELPGDDWVKIRTAYCGICASDLHAIFLNGSMDSPTIPFISFPMVLGHEIVGTIVETGNEVRELHKGERVVLVTLLSCVTRGIDPPCPACQEGNPGICRNFAEGNLPPGIMIGSNKKINGGFAPYVVSHYQQCTKIPNEVSLEEAVLADPFGVALHGILQNPPRSGDKVLVYGCGVLGLCAIISLRTLYPECHIIALGKYAFQRDLAAHYGAHTVVEPGADLFQIVAGITKGKLYKVRRGKPILMGGVHVIYDCVGSADTIETALRLTKERGKVILIGADVPKRFEWSPLWFREITITGSMAIGMENYQGERKHTFEIFLELLQDKRIDVKPLVTHRFKLAQYKDAFRTCIDKQSNESVKVVFDFT